jgi:hypothetical protein
MWPPVAGWFRVAPRVEQIAWARSLEWRVVKCLYWE